MKKFFAKSLSSGLVLLWEDHDIIVVDKPAGLLSIAASGGREKTAYWILTEYYRKKGGGGSAPAVVHRLDRDTSGLMLFARSGRLKKKIMETWNETVTERRYVCVAEGEFTGKEGRIDLPLGEDSGGRVMVREDGKTAVTRWKLLKTGNGLSLLSLELETGRRNQIRAHLAALGHPVAGDKKYFAKTNPLKRLCLHAEKLSFRHPCDGRLMEFVSPVPGGFEKILR